MVQHSTLIVRQRIDICRSREVTTTQLKAMEDLNETDLINKIQEQSYK